MSISLSLRSFRQESSPWISPISFANGVEPNRPIPADAHLVSYWVVESRFLAGAYPGSPESPDQAKHRQRIEERWDAGLRVFINLVEENETNNSGHPFLRYDDVLRELARDAGETVAHLRFPVRDLSVPTLDRMRSILDAVDLAMAADWHCGLLLFAAARGGIPAERNLGPARSASRRSRNQRTQGSRDE